MLGLVAAGSSSLTTRADEGTARAPRAAAAADPEAVGRRSAALQAALLSEVAAQRGDALAKGAETIARGALGAAGSARQQQLTADDAAAQAAAAQIAAQKLQEAVAARQAAVDAGLAATDPTLDPTLLGGSGVVLGTGTTLPAGTRGVLPVASGVVGAKFHDYGHWSSYHTGLDFRAAYGTPIHSVLSGVVVYAGRSGGGDSWAGNHVAVRHTDGSTTMYSHMSRMAVSTGQTVQTGQVIGYVGQTGRAFGAHLHFELYPRGVRYGDVYKAVDPAPWLTSIGLRTR